MIVFARQPQRAVLLSGPEDDAPSEAAMKFRLTYEGEVRPTGNEPYSETHRDPLAQHKHKIRRVFHAQLKQLWQTNRFLANYKAYPSDHSQGQPAAESAYAMWAPDQNSRRPIVENVAALYCEHGYRFVPLVREDWSLLCSLDILFLRRDMAGGVLHAGDIDNRIKTIIDALRRPRNATELAGSETPLVGEDPFFVLMEDDKQVSHFAVETDTLLDPLSASDADQRKAKVIITVELRPYYATMFNLSFV